MCGFACVYCFSTYLRIAFTKAIDFGPSHTSAFIVRCAVVVLLLEKSKSHVYELNLTTFDSNESNYFEFDLIYFVVIAMGYTCDLDFSNK